MPPDMRVTVAGVELTSPIIAASGTFGYGVEFEEILSLDRIGAFVTKGLSRAPMPGNPAPRIIETASGMINAIGLQNMGVQAFVDEKLPRLRKIPNIRVIANVFGFNIEDCLKVIRVLNDAPGIDLYELNASCPNTAHGGMVFGTDPVLLEELVRRTRAVATRPLIVKLSANVTGGLSGPAIKPIAVRMVYEAAKAVKIPILGMGGILKAEDAVEFLLAGATAVQVGTASYADPRAVENIANNLRRWCAAHNVAKVSELTGGLVL